MNAKFKIKFTGNFWIILIAALVFMTVQPRYTVDSVEYLSYIDFFEGIRPFSDWNLKRGFFFPALLWVGTRISYNSFGINLILNFSYVLMLCFFLKSMDLLLDYYKAPPFFHVIKYIVFTIAVAFNLLIFGMFHFVLTDAWSGTLVCAAFYYILSFYIETETQADVKPAKYILFFVKMSIITLILWYLKQMFFTVSLVMIFLLMLIKILKRQKIFYWVGLICGIFTVLFGSIKILEKITNTPDDAGFSLMLLGGERYFEIDDYKMDGGSIILCQELEGTHQINIKDNNYETIKTFSFEFDGTGKSYFKYVIKCMQMAPDRFIKGYWDNYRLLCNLAERPFFAEELRYQTGAVKAINLLDILTGNISSIEKTPQWDISNENRNMILDYLICQYQSSEYMDSFQPILLFYTDRMEKFKDSHPNFIIKKLANSWLSNVTLFGYALMTVTAPLLWILMIILMIKTHHINYITFSTYLLSGFSFAHTMMLVMTGCVIDRYMFSAYIAQLMLYCILGLRFIYYLYIKVKRIN